MSWASRLATWLGSAVGSAQVGGSAAQVVAAAQAADSLLPLVETSVDASMFARLTTVVRSARKDARVIAAAGIKAGSDQDRAGTPAAKRARQAPQQQADAPGAAWVQVSDRRWALTPIGCLPGGRWPRLEVEPALAEPMKEAKEDAGSEGASQADETGDESDMDVSAEDGQGAGDPTAQSVCGGGPTDGNATGPTTPEQRRHSLSHRALAGGINLF
jgi:hypothetical protein